MSIIHEALKKAEREREPLPTVLPLHRGRRAARRRWQWGMTSGLLLGATTAGAVSAWFWLQPAAPGIRTVPPATLAENDAADRPPVRSAPLAVPRAQQELPKAASDEGESRPDRRVLAVEAKATAEAAFERGRTAESKRQWEHAEQYYRQALSLNPTLVEARNNLGNLYIRQHQLDAAIDEFRAALAVEPNYALARNNLGSAYVLSGEDTLAIQEFLAALSIDSVYVSPYYNLASLYARRGDAVQAVAFLTKALV